MTLLEITWSRRTTDPLVLSQALFDLFRCCKSLTKGLVGASGFEPPTSWSRTGESENLKPCGYRTYKPRHAKTPALIGTHDTQIAYLSSTMWCGFAVFVL